MASDSRTSTARPRRRIRSRHGAAVVALIALAGLVAAGCGGGGGSGGGGATIALLLPENQTPRYEAHDRPDFMKKVKQLCDNCKVLYSNANGDAPTQQSNADAALAQGADALVLDPVDAGSAWRRRRPRTCR
jgi:D-xylose transport system substrate-binding protein